MTNEYITLVGAPPENNTHMRDVPYIWLRSAGRENMRVVRVASVSDFDHACPDAHDDERLSVIHAFMLGAAALDVITTEHR